MKQGWEIKKLGELCVKTETTDPTKNANSIFKYVDVSSVSNETCSIKEHTKLLGKDAPSRAKKLIQKNDVIFATVRPTLKRIAIIPIELDNNVCSTGYCVLRAKSGYSNKYIYYFLQSDFFIDYIKTKEKGVSYPAVTDGEVKNSPIPVSSITEQERIVGILDSAFAKIDELQQMAEQNLQNAKDLFQASLKQELTPTQKGNLKLVKDLFDIKTGKLNANAAEDNGLYPFFTCSREVYAINKFAFDCEAILLAGNNASGDFNVKHYNGKFNAYQRTYVITTKSDQTYCKILYYVLENYLSKLKSMSVGANTKFLKLGMIENVQMPDFTLVEQQSIVEKLDALSERCRTMEENYHQTIILCNDLKQALLKKAFNGEL